MSINTIIKTKKSLKFRKIEIKIQRRKKKKTLLKEIKIQKDKKINKDFH